MSNVANLHEIIRSLKQKNNNLRMENERLKKSASHRSAVIAEKDIEVKFLQKRIKELWGLGGFMQVMSHIDTPRGFNVGNSKEAHKIDIIGDLGVEE